MKTILQINTVVNSGSTGRIAEEIGRLAIKNDWSSYIAYGRNKRPSHSRTIKIGSALDLILHGLQSRLLDRHGFGSLQATRKFIEQAGEIKPDIIHLHNLHGYYLNIEILLKYIAEANIPVVWTLHDCWPITGHCAHFDYVNCRKWVSLCSKCPQKRSYPASLFADRSAKNYLLKKELFTSIRQMTIVTVSKWLSDIVNQSFLSNYPVQVINNGIDTDVFKPIISRRIRKKYNLENEFILLGVASIWNNRKGLSDFLELSRLIDKNSRIILVGLNRGQIDSLPQNIIGISCTENQEELAELYSMADVYVNPSVEETFGLTTVEALACGTPAIVYNATACPEVVTHETGFIVEKGNIDGLLNAIETVRRNGKAQYSNICRERAIKLYDKNDRYLDYLNLYESMLKHNRNDTNAAASC